MATHPFAIKLEAAIAHAKKLRDELLNAKATAWARSLRKADKPMRVTRIFAHRQLGEIATGSPNVVVEPGEANASLDKKSMDMNKDARLKALNEAYAKALAKCERARQDARGSGRRQLEDGTYAPTNRPEVSLPCPAAAALAKQISAYISQRYGRVGPKPVANSGGGGGGGW